MENGVDTIIPVGRKFRETVLALGGSQVEPRPAACTPYGESLLQLPLRRIPTAAVS